MIADDCPLAVVADLGAGVSVGRGASVAAAIAASVFNASLNWKIAIAYNFEWL